MIIFLVGIFLILYSVVSQRKYSVWVGMLFILLIMGFQEGISGDYMGYRYMFQTGGAEYGGVGNTTKETEYSYLWFTQAMSKVMSFHLFVMLTSIAQCAAMALIINKYVNKRYRYFGVLLVFFTFNIMLIQMKAMRQGYAIDLLLLSFVLLGERKYFWSLIPAILAYGFHNSSFIAIPFFIVLWAIMFLKRKEKMETDYIVVAKKTKGMTMPMIVLLVFIVFYLFKFVIFSDYINTFLDSLNMLDYSDYLLQIEDNRSIAWWIMLYHAVSVYFVALYYDNEHNLFRRYLALITLVALFLSVGTFGFGNLMRTTAYFIIFSIVVFPNVAAMLRAAYGKSIAVGYVLFNMAYVMITSVRSMLSMDVSTGTGFGMYTFSFLNW